VREGLIGGLVAGLSEFDVHAIVLVACGGSVSADVFDLAADRRQPTLDEVIARFEASTKPVVAALCGTTLGGGVELALGCHYRVAAPDAQCGFPEVKVGLLPGAGGSQRLPRLIGVPKALEMIVGGETISARDGKTVGLIDLVVEDDDFVAGATVFANGVSARRPLPRACDRPARIDGASDGAEAFDRMRRALRARAGVGALAPLRCLEAVKAAADLAFEDGLHRERQLFVEALVSTEGAALRHAWLAERRAARVVDRESESPASRRVTVVGAGLMGARIAMACASPETEVTLVDRDSALVQKSLGAMAKTWAFGGDRRTVADVEARLSRIVHTGSLGGLGRADLVIEAGFDDTRLKKRVFRALDRRCRESVLLVTDASASEIDRIAAATAHPDRVIGLHFTGPAHVMRLVEIVRGRTTSAPVVARAMRFVRAIGRIGVLVRSGFVANRMFHALVREAERLLLDGGLPHHVDHVLSRFGFARGPFALSDLAGIDPWPRVANDGPEPELSSSAGAVTQRLAEMGRFGLASRAGFYRYERPSLAPAPDPVVETIIVALSEELGVSRRRVTDEEIRDRCVLAIANEGARVLDEGLASCASDLDVIGIYGLGFPAYRGGPMFYADSLGLAYVVSRLKAYAALYGPAWSPAATLHRLADQGQTFAALDAADMR
jgi:3-hydroxyacyl-CoA dehydrogenase